MRSGMEFQKTIQKPVVFDGVGVHSGNPVRVVIRPASPDLGIVFIRSDLDASPEIPARSEFVIDTRLATTIGRCGISISTVEHLMAALFGAGIDNALIEVNGP